MKIENMPNRKSPRLKEYDYSLPGYYFITVCTKDQIHYFGEIKNNVGTVGTGLRPVRTAADTMRPVPTAADTADTFYPMVLNENGNIVLECWNDLPNHYHNIELDKFMIMPNHIHGIIIISKQTKNTLSDVVGSLKSFSSRKIKKLENMQNVLLWQPRFYDRIIRDEIELYNVRNYIMENPIRWDKDEYR